MTLYFLYVKIYIQNREDNFFIIIFTIFLIDTIFTIFLIKLLKNNVTLFLIKTQKKEIKPKPVLNFPVHQKNKILKFPKTKKPKYSYEKCPSDVTN